MLIEPSYHRLPSWTGSATEGASLIFGCCCSTTVSVPMDDVLHAGWRWKEQLGQELSVRVTQAFDLNVVGRSKDGGSPAILRAGPNTCQVSCLVM